MYILKKFINYIKITYQEISNRIVDFSWDTSRNIERYR